MNRWVLSALAITGWVIFSGANALGEPAVVLEQRVRVPEKLGEFKTSDLLDALQVVDRADRDEDGQPVGDGPLLATEAGTHPLVLCVEEKAEKKQKHQVYFLGLTVPGKTDPNPARHYFRKVDVDANGKSVEDAVFSLVIDDDQLKTISHPTLSLIEFRIKESKWFALFYKTESSTLVDVKLGLPEIESAKTKFNCYVSPLVEAN